MSASASSSSRNQDEVRDWPSPLVPPRTIWRTVAAALALFAIGSTLLYFGLIDLRRGLADPAAYERGVSMVIVGSLAFLPGSYAVTVMIGSWRRWPGYEFESLPSYDD